MRLAVVAVLLLAPSAGAVAALEEAPRLGAHEARLLVRPEGALLVRADAAIAVGWAPPGGAPAALVAAPATLAPAPATWHGLDGVTELVLARDDAARAIEVAITDETGAGLWLSWPAAKRSVPAPLGALLALCMMIAFMRAKRDSRR